MFRRNPVSAVLGAMLAALLAAGLAACSSAPSATSPSASAPVASPVALRTAPTQVDACDAALLAGELVTSAQSGLAVRGANGVTEVVWPFGYSATRESTGIVLRDPTGKIVVHLGQRVSMGGGAGANGVWMACAGTIEEVSNTGG